MFPFSLNALSTITNATNPFGVLEDNAPKSLRSGFDNYTGANNSKTIVFPTGTNPKEKAVSASVSNTAIIAVIGGLIGFLILTKK